MKVKTGDVFIVARIREFAATGKLEITGDWQKNWKDISIKLAGANAPSTTVE
jgi:hypothetical protein